jgi:hypothetical protein
MSITVSEDILIVNETLTIDGTASSSSTDTGALVVAGGIGIGGDVNVGGTLLVKGTTNVEDTLTLGVGGTSYTFPTERGTSGQLLLFSTSSGGLEFTDLTLLNAPGAFGTDNRLIKSSGTGTDVEITGISLSDTNDLSGITTLDVDSTATIGGDLTVNSVVSSVSNTTGAIVVAGGVGIAENLNVGGDVCFDGDVKIINELTLGDPLTTGYTFPTVTGVAGQILSISTAGTLIFSSNGASPFAVVAPNVFGTDNRLVRSIGTERELEATDVILSDTNDISGINTISVDNDVTIGGVLLLSSTTSSTTNGTGALVVTGGVGIAENLNVGGTTTTDGTVSVTDVTESVSTNSGALTVDGGVGIGGNLSVGGTLTADTIDLGVGDLLISSTTASTSNTSGALVVAGGVGIGGDTNIGGDTSIDGTLTVNSITSITDATSSTNNTTGALIITGGLGLGENLNMGGVLNVNNTSGSTDQNSGAVIIDGGVGIAENLNVGGELNTDGVVSVNNPTNATSSTGPGALVVSGGVSIAKDLYVGGSVVLDEPLVSNSQFFMASHTTPLVVSTTAFSALTWDTEIRKDTGLYAHTASSSNVDVLESGWYKIVANIATEITTGNGTDRTISSARILVEGVAVSGSTSFMYNRTALRGHGACTISILQNLTVGDTINVEINRLLGTSIVTSIANACRLYISRV